MANAIKRPEGKICPSKAFCLLVVGIVAGSSITWVTAPIVSDRVPVEQVNTVIVKLRAVDLGVRVFERSTNRLPNDLRELIDGAFIPTSAAEGLELIILDNSTIVVPTRIVRLVQDEESQTGVDMPIATDSSFVMIDGTIRLFGPEGQVIEMSVR